MTNGDEHSTDIGGQPEKPDRTLGTLIKLESQWKTASRIAAGASVFVMGLGGWALYSLHNNSVKLGKLEDTPMQVQLLTEKTSEVRESIATLKAQVETLNASAKTISGDVESSVAMIASQEKTVDGLAVRLDGVAERIDSVGDSVRSQSDRLADVTKGVERATSGATDAVNAVQTLADAAVAPHASVTVQVQSDNIVEVRTEDVTSRFYLKVETGLSERLRN